MNEVVEQVRAELRQKLIAQGAAEDFADQRVFDQVYGLFQPALGNSIRHALLLPDLLADQWRPELALRLSSHREGPVGSFILFVKRRVMLPLTRWLFEYSLENFHRQDRVNVVLMACLQSLAADHARLRLRVAALELASGAPDQVAAESSKR